MRLSIYRPKKSIGHDMSPISHISDYLKCPRLSSMGTIAEDNKVIRSLRIFQSFFLRFFNILPNIFVIFSRTIFSNVCQSKDMEMLKALAKFQNSSSSSVAPRPENLFKDLEIFLEHPNRAGGSELQG